MDSRSKWLVGYLIFGLSVCLWFGCAVAYGWRAPDLGLIDGLGRGGGASFGRSSGGSWGGGK